MKMLSTTILCLLMSLPLAVHAAPSAPGIGTGISQEIKDARREMHADLAKAREELRTENLQLDHSLRFADRSGKTSASLPKAEITPQGDLLIDGKVQAIDAGQRQQLLAYRQQVVAIALSGIEIGQRGADAALQAVDGSWIGLVFNAMSGRLERRIKRVVKEQIQPAVLAICSQLPAVMASQQRLASTLPEFRPYATLEQDDVADCENEVRSEFASL